MITYKAKLFISLSRSRLFTWKKFINMSAMIYKNGAKYFQENYDALMLIFKDLDKRIIAEKDNYLLSDDYCSEYITFDYRTQLGMFIRGNYINNKRNHDNIIVTEEAETESFEILIGYIFYLNKSFHIFESKEKR